MDSKTQSNLDELHKHLCNGAPALLEDLAANLVGWLLDVQVLVSKAGFQHGGDAGTAGRQGRYLRVECKRYRDSTPLSERELQGEVDDAVRRNPSLETWILVSTRCATENTQETLNLKAEEVGVPIIVIDWTLPHDGIPDLAALCASAPHLVERHYGRKAADAAKAFAPAVVKSIERIRRDLQPWSIGFKALRQTTEQRIHSMWNSDAESRAVFAQNVAGGAEKHLIARKAVVQQLQQWWNGQSDRPVVVFGKEGVGKTWAVVQWIVQELPNLPIILTLPSSALPDIKGVSEASVLEFLARELQGLAGARSNAFWQQRLRRLLTRPSSEGPVMLLLIDGLNQEPYFEWQRLLQVLQGGVFRDKVRVMLTTQTHFLEDGLRELRHISKPAARIGVEPYDTSRGGELDQLLEMHGLQRSDLSSDLIPLARIPRLFPLVIKFRSEAALRGDATVSRLLWAYGRDELSMREGRAFSEQDWEDWLSQLAIRYWDEITSNTRVANEPQATAFTLQELSASAAQAHREPAHNYRRLSEIIDGTWMERIPGTPTRFRPRVETIALALGAALLDRLEQVPDKSVERELASWMDPISATSMAADILAAAASILVAKNDELKVGIAPAVLTALLQSQNATDAHHREIQALAPAIAAPLMETIERSRSRAQASARRWAIDAVRQVPATNTAAWDAIYDRMVRWVAHTTCPSPAEKRRAVGSTKPASERLIERIGTDYTGIVDVLGVSVRLHHWEGDDLADAVPALLQGKPLVSAINIFFAASVATAIGSASSTSWLGLHWLILLNQIDRDETVAKLAKQAEAATLLTRERGVHPEMPKRVGALLLWLTGAENLEEQAGDMRVSFEGRWSYEQDYLPAPSRSFFPLERRHTALVLADESMALVSRLQRCQSYWPDPNLEAPEAFIKALESAVQGLDVEKLDLHCSQTMEDLNFDEYEPGAARFVPDALASVTRRRLLYLANRSGEARHWAGIRALEHLLLVGTEEAKAARSLRMSKPQSADKEERFVSSFLLHLELLHSSPLQQLNTLVEEQDAWLILTLIEVTQPTTPEAITEFLAKWSVENRRAILVLFSYLAKHGTPVTQDVFQQLIPFAFCDDSENLRISAFIALSTSNPEDFGSELLKRDWRAAPGQSVFEQDHGSLAVLVARAGRPLDTLKHIVAPWHLLREARTRGAVAADAKLAAMALDDAVMARDFELEDLGAEISVDTADAESRVTFSVAATLEQDNDAISSLKDVFNSERHLQKQHEARDNGTAHLNRARASGASLYAMNISIDDAHMLVEHCSAEIDAWLDGMDEIAAGFRRRVNLAGGLFLAICEALLVTDPPRGVRLWDGLTQALRIRFVGLAGINDLMHIPFRAKESAAVLALREELYSIHRNPTDKNYLELVVCATANDCGKWLSDRLKIDEASSEDWRRKRAVMMRGMLDCPSVDDLKWFEGHSIGGWLPARRNAIVWRNRHSLALYWWRQFLTAATVELAYAAWQVFLTCADRRAWVWISKDIKNHSDDSPLWRMKMLHFSLNLSRLKKVMEEKERKGVNRMDSHLMGWKSPQRWIDLSVIRDALDE